jgi:OOP family OmpA-OmpF porin
MEQKMKTLNTSGVLGLAVLAMSASSVAVADDAGWYIGANVGQSRATIDNARITSQLLGAGFATTAITDDEQHIGFKLFGGYQLNRYFALEGGYFDLGRFGFTATTLPPGTLKGTIKLDGFNLDAVGLLPFGSRWSAFGRVGANYASAKDTFTGTGAVNVLDPSPSKSGINIKYGAGLQYQFTRAFGGRLEAERYRVNDAVGHKGDVDLFSLGLVYRFGTKAPPPPPPPPPPAPEPVAVAPVVVPPEPAPVVAPPPPRRPVPTKVSFSADSLFGFDKSTVNATGKVDLDLFASDLKGATFDHITVIGHTDRIGSKAYNTKLSMERAEAVKTYMVESGGIAAEKIWTKGVANADPETKPGDCPGAKRTKALIDCLQPDRRVEVEVSGTKQ